VQLGNPKCAEYRDLGLWSSTPLASRKLGHERILNTWLPRFVDDPPIAEPEVQRTPRTERGHLLPTCTTCTLAYHQPHSQPPIDTPKPAYFRTRNTSRGDAGTPHPPNSKPLGSRKRRYFRHIMSARRLSGRTSVDVTEAAWSWSTIRPGRSQQSGYPRSRISFGMLGRIQFACLADTNEKAYNRRRICRTQLTVDMYHHWRG